jgi:hypothetical protein
MENVITITFFYLNNYLILTQAIMNFKISKFQNYLALFFLSFLLFRQEISAQDSLKAKQCGTPDVPMEVLQKEFYFGNNDSLYRLLARLPEIQREVHGQNQLVSNRVWRDDDPSIIWSVPVTFWAYSVTTDDYPTVHKNAQSIIDELNRNFAKNRLPIRFYQVCDVNVIINATFANANNASIWDAMIGNHHRDATLNLHITLSLGGAEGLWHRRQDNRKNAVFLRRSVTTDGTTATHEVGHFFDLKHTHNGYETKDKCVMEPVSRNRTWSLLPCFGNWLNSNLMCNSTGDALCDTPADPNLGFSNMILLNGCGFDNKTIRDLYGDSYYYPPAGASQPDVSNFMSYMLEKTCRNRFSDGQRGIIVSSLTTGSNSPYSAAWSSAIVRFDTYEPDHRLQTARRIEIEEKQLHTFHKNSFGNSFSDCDIDYVYFDVPMWGRYTVFTSPEAGKTHANTIIRVYSYNPTTNEVGALLAENDDFNGTVFSQIERDFTAGRYVVEINNASRSSSPNFGYYNIQILPCVATSNYSLNLSPSNASSLCLFQNYTVSVTPNDVDAIDYVWEITPTTALTNAVKSGNTLSFRVNPFTFSNSSEITISVMIVKACGTSAFLRRTFPIGNPTVLYSIPRQTEFCFNDVYMPYASITLTPQNGVTYSVSTTNTQATITQHSPTDWEVRSSV